MRAGFRWRPLRLAAGCTNSLPLLTLRGLTAHPRMKGEHLQETER